MALTNLYEVDLYQQAGDPELSPGITTNVANYINQLQERIVVHSLGAAKGVARLGGPPYPITNIVPNGKHLRPNSHSIFCVSDILHAGFRDVSETYSVITRHLLPIGGEIKAVHYFSYFVAVAMLERYISPLAQRHGSIRQCPFDNAASAGALLKMFRRGHLCEICEERIREFMREGSVEPILLDSIRTVFQAIAREYRGGGEEEDLPLETEQQRKDFTSESVIVQPPPAEAVVETAQLTVMESAITGRFGFHDDTQHMQDALGYAEYAKALASVITDEATGTPLTVGICAPWGRGKTFLMDEIEEEVRAIAGDKKTRIEHKAICKCININAWRLAKTDRIWAEFYTRILSQVGKGLGFWKSIGFKYVFAWKRSWARVLSATFVLLVGIAAIIYMVVTDLYIPSIITTLASAALVYWTHRSDWVSRVIFSGLRAIVIPSRPGTEQEVLLSTDHVKDALTAVSPPRFVVFVDDIDRCAHDKIVHILESIKLFLDIEGFVFFLAMDARVLRLAVGEHYKFMCTSRQECEEMGGSYLEKLVQVPFSLPKVSGERLKRLSRDLIKNYLPEHKEPEKTEVRKPEEKSKETVAKPSSSAGNVGQATAPAVGAGISTVAPEEEPPSSQRTELDEEEEKTLREILDRPEIDLSPRLLKRLFNVYLIARTLHCNHQRQLNGVAYIPDSDLLKWLALSVMFPFEAKALLEWFELSLWSDPYQHDGGPFDATGRFRLSEEKVADIAGRKQPHPDTPFSGLSVDRLSQFGELYFHLGIEYENIQRYRHITDCFNLVLD